MKTKRTIQSETNSYYTAQELETLTNQGFSWSNKSNSSSQGYDNFIYLYKNGLSYDIEVNEKGFRLQILEPKLLDNISYFNSDMTFLKLLEELDYKTSLSHKILKINSYILLVLHYIFFVMLSSILIPVFYKKNVSKKDSLKTSIKNYFKRIHKLFSPFQDISYYALNEMRIRVAIMYLSIFLVTTTTVINSLLN